MPVQTLEAAHPGTTPGQSVSASRSAWRSFFARLLAVVMLLAGMVALGQSPASANQPTPPFPTGVQPMGVEPVPTDCPRTTNSRWLATNDTDVYRLCRDALRLATTKQAERAILYAFSKLGTPYSQDYVKRTTTHFDCSSFVGRAYTAADARVRKANGVWVDFFPYFGWTGAYVPTAYWSNGTRYGYSGTNVYRVWNRRDLKAGDIIIQFNGANPGNSAGNAGHAQIYLGGNKVIQSGGDVGNVNVAFEGNYLENEWYFRYDGNYKSPNEWVLPGGTVTPIKAGAPGETVLGNLTVTGGLANGFTTLYPCLEGRPMASVNNFTAGQTTPNFAATRADAEGNICLYQSAAAHVVWDQVWAGDEITATNAQRLVDTRLVGGMVPTQGVLRVQTGAPGATVMANLTVVAPQANGYTTVYPCTAERPLASNSNYTAMTVVPNFVATQADENGEVCVYTHAASHLIWDQTVVTDQVPAHAPVRHYDSREVPTDSLLGNWGHRLEPKRSFLVAQVEPGQTVLGNLTVTDPINPGYTMAFPCSAGLPNTSVNNFVGSQTTANFTAIKADEDGRVCIAASEWTHAIWDQMAETELIDASESRRMYDSRSPGIF